ncbi:hypothetical protein GCK72_002269 [Caenorhabditis remanei]|uniref:Uncharacterized protein n=1 Tax=Caenorhabditis remanei TaxID=31234 RepID=A0A6A5HQG4_CAERE|nr:hypothetical protein GCK72_002269 [Caenorhabditis remanei]KAF1770450.1 hypothetical protein GCK72_002269 [Caenorhabditis remanei]
MHHNEYNWYSTNSTKRYQRTLGGQPPRATQFSDEGRFPLGSFSDPENVEMRKKIIESVSENTLIEWVEHQKGMRDKCLLRKRQLGIKQPDEDERYRTYPEKRFMTEDDLENDTQGASDASQPSRNDRNDYDRSKYVLIRKVNPIPTTSAQPSPRSAADSDQIYVDDSQPSTTQARLIVSGKENHRDRQVTSSNGHLKKSRNGSAPAELSTRKPVTAERATTLKVTVPSSSSNAVEECILNKYGHCFVPGICPFSHNGVVKNIAGIQKKDRRTCLAAEAS